MNHVKLTGLVSRSVTTYLSANNPHQLIANTSLITEEEQTTTSGGKLTTTQWHQLIFYGSQAENVRRRLKIGMRVQITGVLLNQTYKKDGEMYMESSINVQEIKILPVICGSEYA